MLVKYEFLKILRKKSTLPKQSGKCRGCLKIRIMSERTETSNS